MKTVYLLGDSTCQNYLDNEFPQVGWGQIFRSYVKDDIALFNLARCGRSTKSFRDENRFEPCLYNMKEGDYVFIQFGHNDEKDDPVRHSDPFGSYQDNLLYFIDCVRKAKATPILLTPIYRRYFISEHEMVKDVHMDYPKAMIQLAERENVLLIDMCQLTMDFLTELGDTASKELFMQFGPNVYPNFPEGKADNTHLRFKGAKAICDILVEQLKKTSVAEILK